MDFTRCHIIQIGDSQTPVDLDTWHQLDHSSLFHVSCIGRQINPCAALCVSIFHSFEAGIANAISSFK